jgi:hypothetical protein
LQLGSIDKINTNITDIDSGINMTCTLVRRVLSHEYPKYRTHLKSLDAESRTLRFGHALADEVLDGLCDQFEANTKQHVLFCIENNELEFVAVAHIALCEEMELAFSVLKDYQGQGMGNLLFRRAIQWCRINNQLKGCMICLTHNQAIKHLCIKYGIKLQSSQGETMADIELDSPSITTYVSEQVDNNLAVMDYLGKRMSKLVAL